MKTIMRSIVIIAWNNPVENHISCQGRINIVCLFWGPADIGLLQMYLYLCICSSICGNIKTVFQGWKKCLGLWGLKWCNYVVCPAKAIPFFLVRFTKISSFLSKGVFNRARLIYRFCQYYLLMLAYCRYTGIGEMSYNKC